MAIEGMPLTDEDKEDMRNVLCGKVSFKEMRQKILTDYKLQRYNHEQV
jgi:hypothetical protein